jgi:hypothetical protein
MPKPSSSNPRKKRGGPPIDLDELYNAPNNRGMCSFLERPPEEARLRDEQTRTVLPFPAGQEDSLAPSDLLAPSGLLAPSDLPADSDLLPPSDMQIRVGEVVSPGGRVTKIHRCLLAQDAHSHGEQVLYTALWNEAKPDREDSRLITIGMGALSRLACMHSSNVRKNLRGLVEKLSIEVTAEEISGAHQGKTYRIFSSRRILENRRQAGLEWIIKSKGVSFVNPTHYGISLPPGDLPAAGKSLAPGDLVTKISAVLENFDDDTVQALWQNCRKLAPDCTAEEVDYCFQVKANQLLRKGKTVTNPVGLMLWAVPKCFEGPQALYLAFRKQQLAGQEGQAKDDREWKQRLKEYQRLAEDPATSAEDRAWYQELLDESQ